ncbi:MAG: alpha/beta hydrolase [Pseudomonadota bacterium]|nr:alpha/beta hydrolase [Pseudomonadota bacterium]
MLVSSLASLHDSEQAMKDKDYWFLLRGLARENGHWHDVLPMLREHYPHSEFHCLDQPGCGQRYQQRSPWHIDQTVEILRTEYLAHKREARKCYIVGLSLGGMIAVAWATKYPEDFYGCVLINTSMPGINARFDRLRPQALLAMLKSFIYLGNTAKREQQLLNLVSNYQHTRERLLPSWVAIQRQRKVRAANYLRMLYSATTFKAPQQAPFAQTLILKARHDRLINARCSDQIQAVWQVPLAEHPTAGHDLTSDEPSWVLEQIVAWRSKHP